MLYFTLFGLLFIAGFLDLTDMPHIVRKIIFGMFFITFFIFSAIRWKTGTDWYNYYVFFTDNNTFSQFTNGNFELGYGILSFLVKSISEDYSVFLTTFSAITLLIQALALKQERYSEYLLISLLIFYSYYVGDIFPIRQSIALAITLFSGKYIVERKMIPFLICVYLATLFHASAIVFVVAYPISTINLKTSTILLALIVAAVGGFILTSLNAFEWIANIPWLASDAQDKLEVYSSMASQGMDTTGGSTFVDSKTSFIVGLIRKVVVLVPLMIFRKKLADKFDFFNIFFNLIIFGAIFYFTLGTLIQVLKRGASYFDFFEVLVLPLFIFICQNKWQRVLIYSVIAAYSLAKLYLVISYYWNLYVPFNTIFDSHHRYL